MKRYWRKKMYNSPIRIDYTDPIFQIRDQLNEKLDETVAKAITHLAAYLEGMK